MGNRLTPVVKYLLIINIAIYLFDIFTVEDLAEYLGLRTFTADEFLPAQLLTYMFLHSTRDFMHILGNMLGLFIFGTWIENVLGPKRFLAFYIITGMGAGVLNAAVNHFEVQNVYYDKEAYISTEQPNQEDFERFLNKHLPYYNNVPRLRLFNKEFYENPDNEVLMRSSKEWVSSIYYQVSNSITVGASGAIFGILIAFALLFPNVELMMLFFPVPIRAKYLVAFYILFELYAGFGYAGASNVAHFAHLGGALIGFILIKYWGIRRQF